jgi:thiamine biosynthesis protein ThiI
VTSSPQTIREFLRITAAGEIYLKSRRTRDRFMRILADNVTASLGHAVIDSTVKRSGYHELRADADDLESAGRVVAEVFGVGKVARVEAHHITDLEDLAGTVVDRTGHRVAGKRFAVRVRRRGEHHWRSRDAETLIGSLLLERSAGVDLGDPEVTVSVHVTNGEALILREEWSGIRGLPLGTQRGALVLLSGGIDSPVAAWMMMRSGCPVDFLHLTMECSVSDQALAIAHDLTKHWSAGTEPSIHVVDFQPVKDAIRESVEPKLRQVVLKWLMLTTGERVAEHTGFPMLVTGDSLGQVSSQTAAHIVELDRATDIPIIRPLIALRKEEIMERAREIGTLDMSLRTQEVCDLSDGSRVATGVSAPQLLDAVGRVGDAVVDKAVAGIQTVDARSWWPGMPLHTG